MENINNGVNPSDSPTEPKEPESVREDDKTPEQPSKPEEKLKMEDKTVPYSRFKEKVDQVNKLEARIKELESLPSSEEVLSQKYPDWDYLDENQKAIIRRQEALEEELVNLKTEKTKNENLAKTLAEFPELKENEAEFKDYCSQKPQTDISILAKSFLFDKKPKRIGLEEPTGGEKTALSEGLTTEAVRRIRETDEKLFAKLVKEGRIDVKKLK